MIRRAAVILACAFATAVSPAQEGSDEEAPAEEAAAEAPAEAMTIEDVRVNFPTVVRAFFDRRPAGLISVRDRETGALRRMRLVSIDGAKAQAAEGDGLYWAPAVLADESGGAEQRAIFTVSFAGSTWSVEKMRLVKPAAKTAKPAPRAP